MFTNQTNRDVDTKTKLYIETVVSYFHEDDAAIVRDYLKENTGELS